MRVDSREEHGFVGRLSCPVRILFATVFRFRYIGTKILVHVESGVYVDRNL